MSNFATRLAVQTLSLITAILAYGPRPVHGATTVINATTHTLREGDIVWPDTNFGIGVNTYRTATEFTFKMPPLPYPQRVLNAELQFAARRGPSITFNADLYALPFRNTPTPLGTDCFAGAYGTAPDAFPLVDNLFTPSTPAGPTPMTVTPVDLAWYLNHQYDRGLQPSSTYLFLRLSGDWTTPKPPIAYGATYNASNVSLVLTTGIPFPEPSTAALVVIVALSSLAARPRLRPKSPASLVASAIFAISLLAASTPAPATTTRINGSMFDRSGGSGGIVGFATTGRWTEFVFRLPVLPANQTISGAILSFQHTDFWSYAPTAFNADLYGLPSRNTPLPLPGDGFFGSFGTKPGAAPLINDLLTPTTPLTTISVAPDSLVAYLNRERMKQPFAETYIPLLLTPDYLFWSNSYIHSHQVSNPVLTILSTEPIPEPALLPLMLGLFLSMRGRRVRH